VALGSWTREIVTVRHIAAEVETMGKPRKSPAGGPDLKLSQAVGCHAASEGAILDPVDPVLTEPASNPDIRVTCEKI
jgi:hypothetical protein